MHNKMLFVTAFIIGAGVGSAVTWKLIKDKYEQLAQEEIDSVKEIFSRRESDAAGKTVAQNLTEELKSSTKEKPDIKEYAAELRKNGYTNYSDIQPTDKEEEEMSTDKPYVIMPEAFMEYEEYDHISLTYYANNVLTDENDEIIEDVEETVGEESLSHFGEYEDDSVYVRNDARKCDYEILLDQRNYSDVAKHLPHQMEV